MPRAFTVTIKGAAALLAIFLLCSCGVKAKDNPWLNEDEYSKVGEKVKNTQKAIIRYGQAEEAAKAEGDADGAAVYRKAKEDLERQLPELENRLRVLERERNGSGQKKSGAAAGS